MDFNSTDKFYSKFMCLGEIPLIDGISEEMLTAMSGIIDRNLDFDMASISCCKEAVALVVLGLIAEGWMVFRPADAPQNSSRSKNYQYIQNTFLED